MTRFRFSIASVMGGIVFIAVSVTALKDPSIFWNSLFFTVTGGTLVLSILCTAFQRGPRRAYWVGFAVLGWGHFLLAFWGNEVPFLLDDFAIKYLQERVIGLREPMSGGGFLDHDGIARQIGLSIVTLLVAFIGGHTTARIVAARDVGQGQHV